MEVVKFIDVRPALEMTGMIIRAYSYTSGKVVELYEHGALLHVSRGVSEWYPEKIQQQAFTLAKEPVVMPQTTQVDKTPVIIGS
jgi:hypothetical protein